MPEVIVYRSPEFRVILDAQSGRPHLVMLYNGKKKYKTIYDFEQFLYRKWLTFLEKILWDLGPAIFSIHLGKYQSIDAPHFHAHFFIPITIFVGMAIANETNINIDFDEWQAKAIEDGKKYKKHDLKNIDQLIAMPKSRPTLPFNYQTVFHSQQPRVGFYDPNKKANLSEVIQAMMSFIKYYGLNVNKKGGAHIVIQYGVYMDDEFKNYLGYVQADIQSYYKINPNRKIWLKQFRKIPYAVLT